MYTVKFVDVYLPEWELRLFSWTRNCGGNGVIFWEKRAGRAEGTVCPLNLHNYGGYAGYGGYGGYRGHYLGKRSADAEAGYFGGYGGYAGYGGYGGYGGYRGFYRG